MTNIQIVNILRRYIEQNEVVYQFCGELMEVSNDIEKGDILHSSIKIRCIAA